MNDFYSYEPVINKPMPKARSPIHRISGTTENGTVSVRKSPTFPMKNDVRFSSPHAVPSISDDDDIDLLDSNSSLNNTFPSSPPSAQTSYSSSRSPIFVKNSSLSRTPNVHVRKKTSSNCNKSFVGVFLILSLVVLILSVIVYTDSMGPLEFWKESEINAAKHRNIVEAGKVDVKINELMERVRAMFPNQRPEIWNDISSGIYDIILYSKKPFIITLFSNQTETMMCLARLLGQVSSKVLGTNDYLTLMPDDFGTDLGEAIYNLKQQISQKRVAVVQDLLSINADAIKVFHNLCDRENPLVEEVVYIITMIADGYRAEQAELEFVENQIYERLAHKIDIDVLNPLIVRITDGLIIPVQPDLVTRDCYFS